MTASRAVTVLLWTVVLLVSSTGAGVAGAGGHGQLSESVGAVGNEDGGSDVDPEKISIQPICSDDQNATARFRIANEHDRTVTLNYALYDEEAASPDEEGQVTVEAGSTKTITVDTVTKTPSVTTIELFADGETVARVEASDTDCEEVESVEDIEILSVCVDQEDREATFKVETVSGNSLITWEANTTNESDDEYVLGDRTYFTVPTDEDGNVEVTFYYLGSDAQNPQTNVSIATVTSNPEQTCDSGEPNYDTSNVTASGDCVDTLDRLAKFTVSNDNDEPVTVLVDGSGGKEITVPANGETEVLLDTNENGLATLHLAYDGIEGDGDFYRWDLVRSNASADCDLGRSNDVTAYQFDLAFGEVIHDLGEDEDAFYGVQNRLVEAQNNLDRGVETHEYNAPDVGTAKAEYDGKQVEYTDFEYDATTGEVTVRATLDADARGAVTMTLAAYELPDGTTEFYRPRADEQVLLDYRTVTLEPGETTTLTVDVDD